MAVVPDKWNEICMNRQKLWRRMELYFDSHFDSHFSKTCTVFDLFLQKMNGQNKTLKTPKNRRNARLSGGFCLVAGEGLEPTTSGLWARRATNCSIPRCVHFLSALLLYTMTQEKAIVFLYFFKKFFLCTFLLFPCFYFWQHWGNWAFYRRSSEVRLTGLKPMSVLTGRI